MVTENLQPSAVKGDTCIRKLSIHLVYCCICVLFVFDYL